MLKQRLSQKQLQKLSPQQIQLMKLLQVPTTSLEQRVKEELESNPALEEGNEGEEEFDYKESELEDEYKENEKEDEYKEDDFDISEYIQDDDIADYKTRSKNYGGDDDEENSVPIPLTKSFHEHLIQQLGMLRLDDKEEIIAEQIIGSIDDDGYLRREPEALVNDLAFSRNIHTDTEELLSILSKVQRFDPPGVGAQSLQECLLIQLERKKETLEPAELAHTILSEYFELFTKKHYQKLMKKLDIDNDDLKSALDEILKLNPKPGSGYSGSSSAKGQQYIVPDFIINNKDGELELELNSRNAPDLHVSRTFREMLKSYKDGGKKSKKEKQAVLFIKQKLDAAKWFIDAIKQRQHTLLSTMHTIMEYQYEFFLTGDEAKLRPMILKDIAERTGLDISTVSRVANSKYVQTEFGTFQLKSFFSESIQKESGEEVSTREVKNKLKGLIEKEDKKKPLSDQKLMELLKEMGYNIARRTVAKYREQLNIPVARLRKELQ